VHCYFIARKNPISWIVPSTATMLFESGYKSSSSSSRIGYTYDVFWVLEEKIIETFTDHLYIALA
jgi:hypothetical protein